MSCLTQDDGRFAFKNLPAGKFSLIAEAHNGRPRYYREAEGFSTGIVTGPGLNSENIVFPLALEGAISGSVTDEEGDPVRNAQVWLFHRGVFFGRTKAVAERQQQTDSSGHFHFSQLTAGAYLIAVAARPWYAQNGLGVGERPAAEFDVAYPITYSGGSTDPNAAALIHVTEGSSVSVEIALRPVPALHIQLPGTEAEGDGPGVMLFAIGPDGETLPSNAVTVGGENGPMMTGVAPGTYEIVNRGVSRRSIELTSDTTLEMLGSRAASLSGRVTFEGAPQSGNAALILSNGTATANVDISPDGSFSVAGLEPGRYRIELANAQSSYIRSVLIADRPVDGNTIELASGAAVQVSIIAGALGPSVDGIVLRDGQRFGGAMVLLLPKDLERTDLIRRDQSDSDGTFTLPNVAPGRYTLVAIDDGHDLAYAEPASIQPYLASGRSITMPMAGNAPIKINVVARQR